MRRRDACKRSGLPTSSFVMVRPVQGVGAPMRSGQ